MSKMQKIWLGIFGAMFLVPEILFWFTPLFILSIVNNFSKNNIAPIAYYFINSQFFTDHPIYLVIILLVEWLGILGLLIMSIKLKNKVFIILFSVFLLWVSFILFFGYVITTMNIVI